LRTERREGSISGKSSQFFPPVAPKSKNHRREIGERRYEINSVGRARKVVSLARLRFATSQVSETCALAWPGRFKVVSGRSTTDKY
jgi:hypothetical protein